MKLQDLFEAFIYSKYATPGTGSISIKNGGMPSMIFLSNDGKPLTTTEDVAVIIVATRKLSEYFKEIYSSSTPENERYDRIELRDCLRHNKLQTSYKELFKKYPQFFKIIDLKGRAKIFRYLTTDLKLPSGTFTDFFGEMPNINQDEDSLEHIEKFHGATLIFTESMRESRKKSLLDMLGNVYEHLASVGLQRLFIGYIRFVQLPPGKLGIYYIKSDDMKIQPKANNSKQVIYTVIHEYGHKFYYQFMNETQRKEITKQFNYLKKSGKRLAASIKFKSKKDEMQVDIHVGDILIYHGKKRKLKQYGKFEVLSIVNGQVKVTPFVKVSNAIGQRLTLSGPTTVFVKPNWSVEGQHETEQNANQGEENNTEKYDRISDSWFPTKYSMTESEEWWAENFAFFVLGHIHNQEVHDWFAQFIK